MPRARTTKKLAQRIDLNYFKRPHALGRWQKWLALGVPILAVAWLAWHGVRRDDTVYSSGRLSAAHAILNSDCTACHVREAGKFSAAAADSACLACHDGPIHKDNQTFTPLCASCHADHRGPIRLVDTRDTACTQCHEGLLSKGRIPKIEAKVGSFPSSHPEFAVLRKKDADPGTIKLNHAVHLKKDLRGANGKPVQLSCHDCHRLSTDREAWRFDEEKPRVALAATQEDSDANKAPRLRRGTSDARRMAPVKFETACAACHLLQFDKRFSEGVPHGKQPGEIRAFLQRRFQEYIASHPAELRVVKEPDRNLTGKPLPPIVRLLMPAQWVGEKASEAEELLWRKTCKQCHTLAAVDGGESPEITKPSVAAQWMPRAKFSHPAHQMLTCTSCHAAEKSTETSDVLMPGIATCRSCHNQSAEGAESRCFLCHTYHDWSREKPVRGRYHVRELTSAK